jgi:transposase
MFSSCIYPSFSLLLLYPLPFLVLPLLFILSCLHFLESRSNKCPVSRTNFKKILVHPEDGGSKFLRNVRTYLPNYLALHSRRLILLTSRQRNKWFLRNARTYQQNYTRQSSYHEDGVSRFLRNAGIYHTPRGLHSRRGVIFSDRRENFKPQWLPRSHFNITYTVEMMSNSRVISLRIQAAKRRCASPHGQKP